jgi:hypothetical protein
METHSTLNCTSSKSYFFQKEKNELFDDFTTKSISGESTIIHFDKEKNACEHLFVSNMQLDV